MAFNPINFLQSGLNQFTPQGGWGIPNIGALQNLLRQQSAAGLRRTNAQDLMGFQRAGLGRSVASAFAPGTRGIQANEGLMKQLQDLVAQNAQMSQSQKAQIINILSGGPLQAAYQEANKPSFLSSLLGNVFGTMANVGAPIGLNKLLGPSDLEKMIMQMFGQSNSGAGTGFATTDNFSLSR
jgi:hypothetical protein